MAHSVLLPLKSTDQYPPKHWTAALESSGLRRCHLFIGVDHDDQLWWNSHRAQAEAVLERAGITFTVVVSPEMQPAGAVCAVWDRLARTAVLEHGRDGWLVLFGDDAVYEAENDEWLDAAWRRAKDNDGDRPVLLHPIDASEPSLCTFPVVHAAHVHRFGSLLPPCFESANQDADPFLHELYRRVGAVDVLHDVRVLNAVGGAVGPEKYTPPRYDRLRPSRAAVDAALDEWTRVLRACAPGLTTVDLVVPSYRCDAPTLARIQRAMRHDLAHGKLIIQVDPGVDDPTSARLRETLALRAHDTRVRINCRNLGASATRNAGLAECWSEVVVFLDDDVEPEAGAFKALHDALIAQGERTCCGAVGMVRFPPSLDVLHEATRMSQILTTFAWPVDIFPKEAPWGVTAFLAVYRHHTVSFDPEYAKTGGGEDLAFCLDVKRNSGGLPWLHVPDSVVVHAFWPRAPGLPGVADYLSHFWKWTQGDGRLLDQYPEHVYACWPNVVEWSAFAPLACTGLGLKTAPMLAGLWLIEVACEATDALLGPHSRHLPLGRRVAAAAVSALVKNVVDVGHIAYFLRRGRLDRLLCRFDWFCGGHNGVVRGERRKFAVRSALWALMAVVVVMRA